ncbi:hypothetical protein [Vibrio crassostreae]|uniref:hypothetical protein n=1 Tax=Vibrio crassostreae TaxID=246167 RepID=UPI001B3006B7|nr:hypothetical protein [Vibrio crassostreae]
MSEYTLTPELAASIKDTEMVWGTTRLLPTMEQIPTDYPKQEGFKKFVGAMFSDHYQRTSNESESIPCVREGFNNEHIDRCLVAHLKSYDPKHQHKIAGVAYMLSLMTEMVKKTDIVGYGNAEAEKGA